MTADNTRVKCRGMKTMTLTAECGALTMTDRPVALPVGAELQMTRDELKAQLQSREPYLKLMVRCPGAKNPAPYMVDASDLWLEVC